MIKLFLDENTPEAIAIGLRLRGYDVLTVNEANRKGLSDIDQLKFAFSKRLITFTFNVGDFYKIHTEFIKNGVEHSGIILSKQLPIGIIVKALLRLLNNVDYKMLRNNVIWLNDWIE